jgi:DNA-binding CsgD family transcriptional regulator
VLQFQADDFDVLDFAALQATPFAGELFEAEFDKLYAVLRKDITSPLIVDGPLYAARYSADRSPTVKEADGHILQASPLADTLLRQNPKHLAVIGGRLSFHHPALQGKLTALIRAALETARGGLGTPGSALLIPRPQQLPLALEVVPLRPASVAFGEQRPAVLIFVRDPEAPLEVARLRELFGFTRTEAAVAGALGRGQSLEVIAMQMGIGLGTVRTHLKRILSKTGTHRQAQAVVLLARCITTAAPQ